MSLEFHCFHCFHHFHCMAIPATGNGPDNQTDLR